jgi:hypothetical protein
MVDSKQVAIRMSLEDLGILHDLQDVLGVRSQSEIIRMALRSLAREHGVAPKVLRSTGGSIRRRR